MKIAIQGHLTRGKEVIQILESLGGINTCNYVGNNFGSYYELHGNSIVCMSTKSDNYKYYTLEEFEKEFPFKIGDKVIYDYTPNFVGIVVDIKFDDNIPYRVDLEGTICTCGTMMLKPYNEMKEERNITLTLDKAKEWYNKGGELKEIALQAFSEKELNSLPRSWEEFCERHLVQKGECWMGSYDEIYCATITQDRIYKNWIPSKKSAEAHLAMIQLEQLRDCWRQGWEPNWLEGNIQKYVIQKWRDRISIETTYVTHSFLSFPTYEMAKEFLECFKDLIEKAGDLI